MKKSFIFLAIALFSCSDSNVKKNGMIENIASQPDSIDIIQPIGIIIDKIDNDSQLNNSNFVKNDEHCIFGTISNLKLNGLSYYDSFSIEKLGILQDSIVFIYNEINDAQEKRYYFNNSFVDIDANLKITGFILLSADITIYPMNITVGDDFEGIVKNMKCLKFNSIINLFFDKFDGNIELYFSKNKVLKKISLYIPS